MAARTKRERILRVPLGRDDTVAGRQRTANLAALDLWPACPNCGDLHPPATIRCPECGSKLTVELPR